MCFFIKPIHCEVFSRRLTGAAVQVTCETRSGRRHCRAVTSDLSFSRLELLECLWQDGKPQYCEVQNNQFLKIIIIVVIIIPVYECEKFVIIGHTVFGKQFHYQRQSTLQIIVFLQSRKIWSWFKVFFKYWY